jgi:methanogenic corrinoid protein MtbC1
MLIWCSYCQQFQGEGPPFEQLNITHGLCTNCEIRGIDLSKRELEHVHRLRDIQRQLMEAGRAADFGAAETIVDLAIADQVRPVDILLGLVAPSLYLIGEEWRRGSITVRQEHCFTSFCEKVYELLSEKMMSETTRQLNNRGIETLLINAEGNTHTFAIRILALWLKSKGVQALALYPSPTRSNLINLLELMQPRLLLISIAVAEQCYSVINLIELLESISLENKPKIIVGGCAVKSGMLAPIAGATLISDISHLEV